MTALIVIEAVVIVLLLILVAGLLRSHAEILRQLDRLGVSEDGEPARPRPPAVGFTEAPSSSITGVDLGGSERTISLENGRSPTLLAFLSSGCASCREFWEALHHEVELPLSDTRIVIVTKGPQSESPSKISELAPPERPLVMSDDTWDLFRVPLTPYFLLVDPGARVLGEGSARSWEHLLGLLRQSAADSTDPTRLDTTGRGQFTDSRLRSSGIEPGDPSLYGNPVDR